MVDLGGVDVVYFYLRHHFMGKNHIFEFWTPQKRGGGTGKFDTSQFLKLWSLLSPKLQKNQF